MSNFERISCFLRDEGIPKTPQEISDWTGIDLCRVYDVLKENKHFFREVIRNEFLIGWTVDFI